MALAVALLKVVEKKGFSLVHYISSCISVGNDLLGLIIDHYIDYDDKVVS